VRSQFPQLGLGAYLGVRSLSVPGGSVGSTTVGTAGAFYAVTTGSGPNLRRVRITAPAFSQSQVTVIRTR
jgi:hypothetical protein